MKLNSILCVIFAGGLMLFATGLSAQDLVYKPINPMLGGDDTFMYQQLLSSAQAQNTLEDPNASSGFDQFGSDPLQDFEESLNRQILSQLSRSLISDQFGEEGVQPGSYVLGNYKIDVGEGSEGLEVVILDESTGNQTTVIIPYF